MTDPIIRTGRDSIVSSRMALRAFLVLVAGSAVLGLLFILDVVRDTRLIASAVTLAAGCLATLVAALLADYGRFSREMRASTVVGWLGVAAWLFMIWFESAFALRDREVIARIAGAFTLCAVWGIFSGVTLAPRTHVAAVVAVRWTVVGLSTFWAAFGGLALAQPGVAEWILDTLIGEQWSGRIIAASAVLVGAGSLAQPVMLRLAASKEGEGAIRGRRAHVSLGCPRCGAACALETNIDGACPACKLSIRVEVDEPRCSCGFLLYGLDSSACPECGAMVPEALRWRAAALTPSQASTPPSP
jgi:hypothetical protein